MKKKNLLLTSIAILGLTLITSAQVPSYVPTNGLVGWWPFNGNANDESGVGNNGFTFGVNTPTLQSDRFGNSNSSYYFYGENGEIKIPTSNGDLLLDPMQDSYSVSFWLKSIDPTLTASTGLVLHQWGGNTWTSYPFSFQISPASNLLSPAIYDGVSANSNIVGNSVFDDQWHMITMVKDNFVDTLFSFADGVLIDAVEITLSGPLDPIYDTIRVGPRFLGKIDDIGIWNRALTQAEITDLFTSSSVGISEVSQSNLFSVYPNPANSQINVKADANLLGSIYTVYDNTGKVVLSGKINTENTVIELGNLSGGVYLFSVGENLKQTFKVIKE